MNINQKIGQKIKNTREAAGLSMRELARMSNTSHITIHNIENAIKSPTLTILEGIFKALNIKDSISFDD